MVATTANDMAKIVHQLCDERDRLRAELTNARLERDNTADLNSSLIAELVTKGHELEGQILLYQEVVNDNAAKDGIIANLNERSAQYEHDTAAKDARIAIITQALETSCANVTDRDARIAELEDHAVLATLAKNNDALRARIAELEALVADQKAATDEEFQNCSKIEAELAGIKAALDARDEQLRMMASDSAAKDARIASRVEEQFEKNVRSADWQSDLELYKPRVVLVERIEPAALAPSPAGEKERDHLHAERDAMRDKLRWALHELREHQADYHHVTPPGDIGTASAALAPSPAGWED